MAQANPTTPVTMVNLDLIEDAATKDVLRNLSRQIEAIYKQSSQVINLNLARTVKADGPNPPAVADGESIVWFRTDLTPNQVYIVSRDGGTLNLWQAGTSMPVPGGGTTGGGGGTPPPPSAPVIQSFSPLTGPVGTSVAITGSGFTGASSVLINGQSMTFSVVNDTRINATVPNGAVSGPLKVITPGGSASSASPFQVSGTVSSGPPAGAGLPIQGTAVPTFHSIGLYWNPKDSNGNPVTPIANPAFPGAGPAVAIRYAKLTDTAWKAGHDLWYDSRDTTVNSASVSIDPVYGRKPEARGSIVLCDTGTPYIVQFGLYAPNGSITWIAENRPVTWSELGQPIPVGGYGPVEGQRITTIPPIVDFFYKGGHSGSVNQGRQLNQSGTPSGWTVYDFTGQTIDDTGTEKGPCLVIDGSFIILRGVKTLGGQIPVLIQPGSHDILIEKNDFSKWGQNLGTTFQIGGVTYQGGITTGASEMSSGITIPHQSFGTPTDFANTKRIIVQRNRFHAPKYGSNPWDYPSKGTHPQGPSPIQFYPNGGNNVVRYNEAYATTDDTREGPQDVGHSFNDGLITGGDNQSLGGIGPDTDIYKNFIRTCMDDSCETDGGGMNTRYWKNYADITNTGGSNTPTYLGPLYRWRNVYNRCREFYEVQWGSAAETDRTEMCKCGGITDTGGTISNGGRRYVYHETMLQFPSDSYPGAAPGTYLGGWHFLAGTGGADIENTICRNNLADTRIDNNGNSRAMYDTSSGVAASCVFDHDICTGAMGLTDTGGLGNTPITFQTGHGALALGSGLYQLAPQQPGHGDAAPIPNFNDMFPQPDRGAHQDGLPPMDFGLNASGA